MLDEKVINRFFIETQALACIRHSKIAFSFSEPRSWIKIKLHIRSLLPNGQERLNFRAHALRQRTLAE